MDYFNFQNTAIDIQLGELYLVLDYLTIFCVLILLLIMVSGIVQVLQNRKLDFWQKSNWVIFTVLFPLITPLLFFMFYRRKLNRR